MIINCNAIVRLKSAQLQALKAHSIGQEPNAPPLAFYLFKAFYPSTPIASCTTISIFQTIRPTDEWPLSTWGLSICSERTEEKSDWAGWSGEREREREKGGALVS